MTPRRWYAIATLLMLVTVPAFSAAATNRVLNGDCDEAGADPTDIPHWINDDGSPAPTVTARVDGLGVDATAACVIVGVGVLRTASYFTVTGGEELVFTADVWEIRNDQPASRGVQRSDSVVALEFFYFADLNGDGILDQVNSPGQFELHCDALVDARDNGVFDRSDSCTVTDFHVPLQAKDATDQFECQESVDAAGVFTNPGCTKYDGQICNHVDPARNDADCTTSSLAGGCLCIAPFANPLLVSAGATHARVLLGGALATDVDPILRTGLESPTTITAFDNIVVGN